MPIWEAKRAKDKGVNFYRNWGAGSVGNRNECLVLSTVLIIKGKLVTVKRFEC